MAGPDPKDDLRLVYRPRERIPMGDQTNDWREIADAAYFKARDAALAPPDATRDLDEAAWAGMRAAVQAVLESRSVDSPAGGGTEEGAGDLRELENELVAAVECEIEKGEMCDERAAIRRVLESRPESSAPVGAPGETDGAGDRCPTRPCANCGRPWGEHSVRPPGTWLSAGGLRCPAPARSTFAPVKDGTGDLSADHVAVLIEAARYCAEHVFEDMRGVRAVEAAEALAARSSGSPSVPEEKP